LKAAHSSPANLSVKSLTRHNLEHRPVADGQRVAGIYRRSVMLASGRYATLDDGMGFSLVPWKPMIEQRLGSDGSVGHQWDDFPSIGSSSLGFCRVSRAVAPIG
jgi:hypothetical protein